MLWPSEITEEWRRYMWRNEAARHAYMRDQLQDRDRDWHGRLLKDVGTNESRTIESSSNGGSSGTT